VIRQVERDESMRKERQWKHHGNEWVEKDDEYSKWAMTHLSYMPLRSDFP
jgi:hypothetical protein